MEPTAYVNGEVEDPENMEDADDITFEDVLARKTPDQRVKYLRRHFFKTEQAIQDMRTPEMCEIYPDFVKEVEASYLQYTTFTAKVWTNYDGACKQFFTDKRMQDCGKLVLNKRDKDYFDGLKSSDIQVNRVNLAVGTAFRTLGEVVLRAVPGSGEIKAIVKPHTGEHALVMKFLIDVCATLSGLALPKRQTGFTLDNLEQIAQDLVRNPNDNKTYIHYQSRWRAVDEWTYTGRGFPHNPGYMPGLH